MTTQYNKINIAAVPSQTFLVSLGGQSCQITIHSRSTGVFVDLSVGGSAIVTNRIVRDGVPIVRQSYLGFIGDLVFLDTVGGSDPEYAGFNTRYLLCYLEDV